MKTYTHVFEKIISLENLFVAWDSFRNDKRNKKDVRFFEWNLEENIFQLHRELEHKTYKHGPYSGFYIHDPKQRHIHKALVRDRALHHAICNIIGPIFEPTFIKASFSCRIGFGTHKGIDFLERTLRRVSKNDTEECFVLKCDIQKFFDTMDHDVLFSILKKKIRDENALWLLNEVIESFASPHSNLLERKGVPIGNLTSQLFANIYMNEFDQFVKHRLKVKNYVRYTDDFAIIASDSDYLKNLIDPISVFIENGLRIKLHPNKVSIRKFHQGIDFLGYIIFPHHRLVRTRTRKRFFSKIQRKIEEFQRGYIKEKTLENSIKSYLGVLSHANAYLLSEKLRNQFYFWLHNV